MKNIRATKSHPTILHLLLVLIFLSTPLFADDSNRVLILLDSLDVANEIFEWSRYDDDARERNPSPIQSLNTTNPKDVAWLMPIRAEGQLLEQLRKNPDTPRARLERMILIDYPIHVDRGAIVSDLKSSQSIRQARNSSTVSVDKFFSQATGYGNPTLDDWAFDYVNTSQAWALAGGWAYVAVPDFGVDMNHPDLIDMNNGSFEYGNFHKTLAWDIGNRFEITDNEPNPHTYNGHFREEVDEGVVRANTAIAFCSTSGWAVARWAGHGTAVSTVLAGNTENGIGTNGICKDCAIAIYKATYGISCSLGKANVFVGPDEYFASIAIAIDVGAQVINMSAGIHHDEITEFFPEYFGMTETGDFCNSTVGLNSAGCTVIEYAKERDVVIVAASGNDSDDQPDFPAFDPDVIGVGGIDRNGARWDDCNDGLSLADCGGNFGRRGVDTDLGIEVSAPAQEVAAGFHIDRPYAPSPNRCDDSWVLPDDDGYGWCSGTSMATPIVSGIVGIMRSINPLVKVGSPTTSRTIREALKISTDRWQLGQTSWNENFGYGVPDAKIAAEIMLGKVNGQLVKNRATPLFSMYNSARDDRTYTAIPQLGSTFSRAGWVSEGAIVPNYTFPESQYYSSPQTPRADVFVLTTEYSPFTGNDVIPLYELTFEEPNSNGSNPNNADWLLVTGTSDVEIYVGLGYKRRGIQGYIFSPCSSEPSCIPNGAVKLYRAYDLYNDDHAVFPASKLSYMQGLGYTQGLIKLGYAYPNTDSDSDGLIDGMEYVIGTDPTTADSDCDGQSDGYEFPQAEIYRSDPQDGSCSNPEQTPWGSNVSGTIYNNTTWDYAMGYHFTPTSDGKITKLGGYFNGTKTVKLFNKSTGALLASASVSSNGNWAYGAITPVSVNTGVTYTVAVYLGGSGGKYVNSVPGGVWPQTFGDITINSTTYISTASNPDAIPTNGISNAMYGMADIGFTPD